MSGEVDPREDQAGRGEATGDVPPTLRRSGQSTVGLVPEEFALPDTGKADLPHLAAGEQLAGRFTVLRFVARGGMGAVYEATDVMLRVRVALKVLEGRIAADPAAMERFRREVLLARRVSHPNVCRVYELYQATTAAAAPVSFLTMEFLEGETLAARLAREGCLTTTESLPLVQQMCEGLAAAHAEGIVHRDFKTSNVMLVLHREGGGAAAPQSTRVVITDFGVARALLLGSGDAQDSSLTGAAGILGTPEYMAPEQVTGGAVTPATDVYALGVVMYEMVTGKLPFAGDTPLVSAAMRINEAPPPPHRAAPGLDPRWNEGIVRCLAREPERRPQSARAVVSALIKGSPRRRWRPFAFVAGGACLVALVGLLIIRETNWPGRLHGPVGADSSAPRPSPAVAPQSWRRWLVPLGGARLRGPADALVTVVEYGDYQCPYTREAEPVVQRLSEKFPGKIRVVWRDYPLGLHPQADGAAQLALEAMRQRGDLGFWQAHDRLLASSLGRPDLERLSLDLDLDLAEVRGALRTDRHRAAIDADVQTLERLGSEGTPTFFVNGRKVVGSDELDLAVVDALAEARKLLASGVPAGGIYEAVQRGARPVGDPPRRVVLPPPGSRPARGGSSPRAVVVNEFCELSLAWCAWVEPTLRKILEGYGDEVRLVWWDVSDLQRPESRRVRRATSAAARGAPRRFWAMHDAVLADLSPGIPQPASPEKLALPALREKAKQAGADPAVFDYEMASDFGGPMEDREVEEARAVGLRPGQIVIDGEVLSGGSPAWVIRNAIDRALGRPR